MLFRSDKPVIVYPMAEHVLTCKFLFTSRELWRGIICFWPLSSVKWIFAFFGLLLLLAALEPVLLFKYFHVPLGKIFFLRSAFLVLMIVALFLICILFPFYTFRMGPLFNRVVTYRFGHDKIYLQSNLVNLEIRWELCPLVIENEDGFALSFPAKKSFSWFPKSGFEAPESINLCRELFRKNVKDSRRLFLHETATGA